MPLYTNPVTGLTYNYEFSGTGQVKCIFVMGLLADHKSWEYQTNYFKDSADFQLLVFDNRGVGLSSKPKGRYTTKIMAQDAKGLLDGLGWEKVHVVGISMGGMISQELALLLGEERVLSLCLLCTHTGGWSNTIPPVQGLSSFLKQLTLSTDTDIEYLVELNINRHYGSKTLADKDAMAVIKDYHRRIELHKKTTPYNKHSIQGQMSACITHNVTADRLHLIRDMRFPKLCVTGDEDKMVVYTNSIYIAKQINAELVIVQGHGHSVHVSYHKTLNPLMVELWKGIGPFATSAEMRKDRTLQQRV
eukprot:CFRG2642T1